MQQLVPYTVELDAGIALSGIRLTFGEALVTVAKRDALYATSAASADPEKPAQTEKALFSQCAK